jgi:hypothetical protein
MWKPAGEGCYHHINDKPREEWENFKRTYNALELKRLSETQVRMMEINSGRNEKSNNSPHPTIYCSICFNYLNIGARFKCLDCKKFNLCEYCEVYIHVFLLILLILIEYWIFTGS